MYEYLASSSFATLYWSRISRGYPPWTIGEHRGIIATLTLAELLETSSRYDRNVRHFMWAGLFLKPICGHELAITLRDKRAGRSLTPVRERREFESDGGLSACLATHGRCSISSSATVIATTKIHRAAARTSVLPWERGPPFTYVLCEPLNHENCSSRTTGHHTHASFAACFAPRTTQINAGTGPSWKIHGMHAKQAHALEPRLWTVAERHI